MKQTVQVEVQKETHELAQSLVALVLSAKDAVKDGFQPGSDIPVIVGANLTSLMTGIAGIEQMGAEAKEDMEAFMNAWTLAGTKIAASFLKKEEIVAPSA